MAWIHPKMTWLLLLVTACSSVRYEADDPDRRVWPISRKTQILVATEADVLRQPVRDMGKLTAGVTEAPVPSLEGEAILKDRAWRYGCDGVGQAHEERVTTPKAGYQWSARCWRSAAFPTDGGKIVQTAAERARLEAAANPPPPEPAPPVVAPHVAGGKAKGKSAAPVVAPAAAANAPVVAPPPAYVPTQKVLRGEQPTLFQTKKVQDFEPQAARKAPVAEDPVAQARARAAAKEQEEAERAKAEQAMKAAAVEAERQERESKANAARQKVADAAAAKKAKEDAQKQKAADAAAARKAKVDADRQKAEEAAIARAAKAAALEAAKAAAVAAAKASAIAAAEEKRVQAEAARKAKVEAAKSEAQRKADAEAAAKKAKEDAADAEAKRKAAEAEAQARKVAEAKRLAAVEDEAQRTAAAKQAIEDKSSAGQIAFLVKWPLAPESAAVYAALQLAAAQESANWLGAVQCVAQTQLVQRALQPPTVQDDLQELKATGVRTLMPREVVCNLAVHNPTTQPVVMDVELAGVLAHTFLAPKQSATVKQTVRCQPNGTPAKANVGGVLEYRYGCQVQARARLVGLRPAAAEMAVDKRAGDPTAPLDVYAKVWQAMPGTRLGQVYADVVSERRRREQDEISDVRGEVTLLSKPAAGRPTPIRVQMKNTANRDLTVLYTVGTGRDERLQLAKGGTQEIMLNTLPNLTPDLHIVAVLPRLRSVDWLVGSWVLQDARLVLLPDGHGGLLVFPLVFDKNEIWTAQPIQAEEIGGIFRFKMQASGAWLGALMGQIPDTCLNGCQVDFVLKASDQDHYVIGGARQLMVNLATGPAKATALMVEDEAR